MNFNSGTTLALASLGAAIGAIAANTPKSRSKFVSSERLVGSVLGFSTGLAVGYLAEASQPTTTAALGDLFDTDTTPLKLRPIQLVRADAPAPFALSPAGLQAFNQAALPPLADRVLITY